MVVKKDYTKETFAIAIIALLGVVGVAVGPGVFDNELADYYVCDVDGVIAEFKGGISGTGYSGYPFADSRKGAVRCGTSDAKGEWVVIKDYAKKLDVDPYDLLKERPVVNPTVPITPSPSGVSFLCTSKGCTPK